MSGENRTMLVDREEYVVDCCRGRSVLHLGAADWPKTEERLRQGRLLHSKLAKVAGELVGVDNSEEGVSLLRNRRIGNLLAGDVYALSVSFPPDRFDVVVAGEIIEHLDNPGGMLGEVRTVLKPDGLLLLSTINAQCLFLAIRGLFGKERVHRDHLAYYSARTLRALLERTGFEAEEIRYYTTRAHNPLSAVASTIHKCWLKMISPASAAGIILKARPVGKRGFMA